jgi:hypothetical protein
MAKQRSRKRKTALVAVGHKKSVGPLSQIRRLERPDLLILLALGTITFGIYAQVIGHQFITLDDPTYIRENPMVNRGVTLAGLTWAFTTFYAANWHPLTWIAHMVDSQLFGMNAGGHLVVNALIHTANTLLLFWLLLGTTRARWPSALVAALFALHPLHVESVAWAAERKDTLSTFFGFFSLIAYAHYVETRSRKWYMWTAVTLALGLLAKPILVTWPFVILLLDYWPLRRLADVTSKEYRRGASHPPSLRSGAASRKAATGIWPLLREKLPLFALAAASAIMTLIAQSREAAVRTLAHEPIALRLSNALVSYAKYLLLTFWPNDLAVYYPFAGIPSWQVIGAAFLLIELRCFVFLNGEFGRTSWLAGFGFWEH